MSIKPNTVEFYHACAISQLLEIQDIRRIINRGVDNETWGDLLDEERDEVRDLGRHLRDLAELLQLDMDEGQGFPDLVEAAVRQGIARELCESAIDEAWSCIF